MGVYKVESLRIGSGTTQDYTTDSQIFVGNGAPTDGAAQPGVYPIGKDGDLFIRQDGADSKIYIKANDAWSSVGAAPVLTTALADNQVAATNILTFSSTAISYITIEYKIKRVGDDTRIKQGKFSILADPAGVFQYSSELDELGTAVGVTLSVDMSGSTVRLRYTSTNEGAGATFDYTLGGF